MGLKFIPIAVQDLHPIKRARISRFKKGCQQCCAMQIVLQLPGLLACKSSMSASLSAWVIATFSTM